MNAEKALARIIWNASRADEGTISAIGADVIARAILASDWLDTTKGLREAVERLAEGWEREANYPNGHSLLCQVYAGHARDLRALLADHIEAGA